MGTGSSGQRSAAQRLPLVQAQDGNFYGTARAGDGNAILFATSLVKENTWIKRTSWNDCSNSTTGSTLNYPRLRWIHEGKPAAQTGQHGKSGSTGRLGGTASRRSTTHIECSQTLHRMAYGWWSFRPPAFVILTVSIVISPTGQSTRP